MQEERDNLRSPLPIEEIEAVVKTFPQRKLQALMASQVTNHLRRPTTSSM